MHTSDNIKSNKMILTRKKVNNKTLQNQIMIQFTRNTPVKTSKFFLYLDLIN